MNVTIEMDGDLKKIVARRGVMVLVPFLSSCAELVKSAIAQYPGPVVRPIRWASQRQRWWVLHNVNPLPYVRQSHPNSQRLALSYYISPEDKASVSVKSKATYAAYVQSEAYQQLFHKETGWKTDKQAVDEVNQSGGVDAIWSDFVMNAKLW